MKVPSTFLRIFSTSAFREFSKGKLHNCYNVQEKVDVTVALAFVEILLCTVLWQQMELLVVRCLAGQPRSVSSMTELIDSFTK
jgi:hypothetical protein